MIKSRVAFTYGRGLYVLGKSKFRNELLLLYLSIHIPPPGHARLRDPASKSTMHELITSTIIHPLAIPVRGLRSSLRPFELVKVEGCV